MESALLKLRRADAHFGALKAAIDAHDKTINVAVELESDPAAETQIFAVRVTRAPQVPSDDWSPIFGDAIQNMRASLDHLAYSLVEKCQGAPWQGSQFPLADAPENYSWRDRQTLDRLDDDERAFVERFQPHAGRSGLALLRDISNEDKHRQFVLTLMEAHVTLRAQALSGCTNPEWFDHPEREPMRVGAVLGRVRVRRTEPEATLNVAYEHAPYVTVERHGPLQEIFDTIYADIRALFTDARAFFP